jgi:hypothetical protein
MEENPNSLESEKGSNIITDQSDSTVTTPDNYGRNGTYGESDVDQVNIEGIAVLI